MLIKKMQNENNNIVKLNSSEIYDTNHNNLLNNILFTKYLFEEEITFDFNGLNHSKKNITLNDDLNNYDFIYITIIQYGYGTNYIVDIKTLMEGLVLRDRIFTHGINSYYSIQKITNTSVKIHLENTTVISGSLGVLIRIKGYNL